MDWLVIALIVVVAAAVVGASRSGLARGRPQPPPRKARWITADANRFGVPLLDLGIDGMISTTTDPAVAAKAVSWGLSTGEELAGDVVDGREWPCDLAWPVAALFPDGLLFTPQQMEDKWVLAHRGGRLIAARSWTGEALAVATVERDGDVLQVRELVLTPGFEAFGDPVQAFDWLVRTHALGETHPLPADEKGLGLLEATPLALFGPYGRRARWAARGWQPGPPSVPLRSSGAVLRAVQKDDVAEIGRLAAAGHPVDAPSPIAGYTPLCVAAVRGRADVVRAVLAAGADPNLPADRGMTPMLVAVVRKAPVDVLQALFDGGADPLRANVDGFTGVHAMAEVDAVEPLAWLVAHGVDLEARNQHGHTAVHVACGLGHVRALQALLEAGADPLADSPSGRPIDVARNEKKDEAVRVLERWRSATG